MNLKRSRVHRVHPILAKRGLTLHSGFLLSWLQLHPLSAKMCTDAPSATARMHAGVRSVLTFPALLSILTTFSSEVMGARVPGTCTGGARFHLRRVFDAGREVRLHMHACMLKLAMVLLRAASNCRAHACQLQWVQPQSFTHDCPATAPMYRDIDRTNCTAQPLQSQHRSISISISADIMETGLHHATRACYYVCKADTERAVDNRHSHSLQPADYGSVR